MKETLGDYVYNMFQMALMVLPQFDIYLFYEKIY